MTDNEENKTGDAQKRFCPKNYIRRLQAEGFVQWDPVTWIHPKDLPAFIVKGKNNRSRRRRALVMVQREQAKLKAESQSA